MNLSPDTINRLRDAIQTGRNLDGTNDNRAAATELEAAGLAEYSSDIRKWLLSAEAAKWLDAHDNPNPDPNKALLAAEGLKETEHQLLKTFCNGPVGLPPKSALAARTLVDRGLAAENGYSWYATTLGATALRHLPDPGTPRVLGLDLSLTATGVAHPNGALSTITPPGRGDERLRHLRDTIAQAAANQVDLAVIEDLPTHANSAGVTGMVHGVARTALMDAGVPYVLVSPASLKKYAAGRGNATKPDMRMALYQRAGLDVRDDNQVDAYWLRAMGLDQLGHAPVRVPEAHRAALAKAAWPQG